MRHVAPTAAGGRVIRVAITGTLPYAAAHVTQDANAGCIAGEHRLGAR